MPYKSQKKQQQNNLYTESLGAEGVTHAEDYYVACNFCPPKVEALVSKGKQILKKSSNFLLFRKGVKKRAS